MDRSGRLFLKMMVFSLMHSQSDASFLAISFEFNGLSLIDTRILSAPESIRSFANSSHISRIPIPHAMYNEKSFTPPETVW